MKLLLFSLVSTLLLTGVQSQAKQDLPPMINAYITVLDPQHLNSVRVNIEKSEAEAGKISKSEINFGDGVKSEKMDVIHSYAANGTYNIVIKVWDKKNLTAQYSKSIEIASNLILSDGPGVFGPTSLKENKNYSFAVNPQQLNSLYKVVLTRNHSLNVFYNYFDRFRNYRKISG